MNLRLFDREIGKELKEGNKIMKMSTISSDIAYEGFGIQSDG
jgi:hypothetical protein